MTQKCSNCKLKESTTITTITTTNVFNYRITTSNRVLTRAGSVSHSHHFYLLLQLSGWLKNKQQKINKTNGWVVCLSHVCIFVILTCDRGRSLQMYVDITFICQYTVQYQHHRLDILNRSDNCVRNYDKLLMPCSRANLFELIKCRAL